MPPPITRLKSSAIDSGTKPDRKRCNSDMEVTDIEALSDKINGVHDVCRNILELVRDLTLAAELLMDENSKIKAELNKLQQLHISNQVPDVQKKTSYACAVKSKPVVIVRPKDASQSSSLTKKALRAKVVPSNNIVCDIRNTAHGGIVIECDNNYWHV